MAYKQKTIKRAVTFSGLGVHNGLLSSVILTPAAPGTGTILYNAHFPDEIIKIGSVVPEVAMHATVIKQQSWFVSTIEHLMAALWVLGVDNVHIQIEGTEVPILDGSALPFMHGIMEVGLEEQSSGKQFLTPKSVLTFSDDKDRVIQIVPALPDVSGNYCYDLSINYSSKFDHPLVGASVLNGDVSKDFFTKEIAPARTFGFLEQLPLLRKHGLAQGTTLGNTVVIGPEGFMNEVRFADEFVRHKFLDFVGDLSLLGKPLIGAIKAQKTGHSFNRCVVEHYVCNPNEWALVS